MYNTITLIESSGSKREFHLAIVQLLIVRRKVTRGIYLNKVAQSWEDERM